MRSELHYVTSWFDKAGWMWVEMKGREGEKSKAREFRDVRREFVKGIREIALKGLGCLEFLTTVLTLKVSQDMDSSKRNH